MKIIADENIPLLEEVFGNFGQLTTLPGRDIRKEHVKDADLLLVRSVTPVGQALLEGSSVRQVASLTIGDDHVDRQWLQQAGIPFFNAPGSNAQSVVEYVLSCLSILSEIKGFQLTEISVGIVGRGHIGSQLEKTLKSLGVMAKACDPPLAERGVEDLDDLDDVLACDVVSLHVPLTRSGPHATASMVDADFLSRLEGHQMLINTSRGGVIDERALKARLRKRDGFEAILDVWRNEPDIDAELAAMCLLATPHIAGYSLDGRVAATESVAQQVTRAFGLPYRARIGQYLPEPPLKQMTFSQSADPVWALHTAIRACFDVRHDDASLRRALQGPAPGPAFDQLRKAYRPRRAFAATRVKLKGTGAEWVSPLKAAGFTIRMK